MSDTNSFSWLTASRTVRLSIDVLIDAPVDDVFAAITDWPAQGLWMLGTSVTSPDGLGDFEGARLEAFSGGTVFGKSLGFLDTMEITRWESPYRVDVLHTGNVVRGTGTFEVIALPGGRSRFVWAEDLVVPLGLLGRVGWVGVRPFFASGVKSSLKKFGRLVETGVLPRRRPTT